jgi:hypothetical protein
MRHTDFQPLSGRHHRESQAVLREMAAEWLKLAEVSRLH